MLAAVLYQRKRRLTLFLALGLELVIPLLCICDIVFSCSLWGPAWKDLLLGQAIAAVIALLLLLFAAFQDWKEKSGIAKFNRAIWFVPGILYLVNNLSNLHQGYLAIINHAPDHDRYMLSMFSILAIPIKRKGLSTKCLLRNHMDSLTDSRSIRALALQTPHKRCFAPTAVGNCCRTRHFASTVAPDARNCLGLTQIKQNKRYSVPAAAGNFCQMRISAVPAAQSAM